MPHHKVSLKTQTIFRWQKWPESISQKISTYWIQYCINGKVGARNKHMGNNENDDLKTHIDSSLLLRISPAQTLNQTGGDVMPIWHFSMCMLNHVYWKVTHGLRLIPLDLQASYMTPLMSACLFIPHFSGLDREREITGMFIPLQ